MGSENQMNDGTSFQQSDMPIFCANGCGFFGTAATMNLCSKCYRDHRMKEEQAASAKAAVEKSMCSIPPAPVLLVQEAEKAKIKSVEPVTLPASSSDAVTEAANPNPNPNPNRCGSCSKKVGVMGFKCRCGVTFCGSHRYPEEHGCSFDFKGAGKDAIAKANPVVKADKVKRF